MRQTLIGLILLAILAGGLWWQRQQQTPPVEQHEIFAMGTVLQISLTAPAPDGLLPALHTALTEFDARWSTQADGALVTLNTALSRRPSATLPTALREGILTARRACQQSDGLFDPGIGNLVRLWGFDDESRFREKPPADAAIKFSRSVTRSLCDAKIGAKQINLGQAGTRLDLGGSAKGRAVAELVAILRSQGVNHAIVNAGGDLQVIGQRQDRPWRIGIRHPRPAEGREVLASVELHDGEAMFTSGDYERYFEHAGKRYHHILDPRTGYPATASQSATVIAADPEWADAASTALFIAGPKRAKALMQKMQITHYLLVDAQGQEHISPALAERLIGRP